MVRVLEEVCELKIFRRLKKEYVFVELLKKISKPRKFMNSGSVSNVIKLWVEITMYSTCLWSNPRLRNILGDQGSVLREFWRNNYDT